MNDKWFEIEEELRLLKTYMEVYIQLLPECIECGGKRLHKPQLPTFEYYKKTFNDSRYSLYIPHYKETKIIVDGKITNIYTHGMGTSNGIAYRGYNYWMGCKFYPPYNFEGDYTVCGEELQKHLK